MHMRGLLNQRLKYLWDVLKDSETTAEEAVQIQQEQEYLRERLAAMDAVERGSDE